MAAHSVTKAKTATLSAGVVDSVTVQAASRSIEVVHHGNVTSPLYLLVGVAVGAPTAAGDNCEVVLPGERVRFQAPPQKAGDVVCSVISAGAATYTVTGIL